MAILGNCWSLLRVCVRMCVCLLLGSSQSVPAFSRVQSIFTWCLNASRLLRQNLVYYSSHVLSQSVTSTDIHKSATDYVLSFIRAWTNKPLTYFTSLSVAELLRKKSLNEIQTVSSHSTHYCYCVPSFLLSREKFCLSSRGRKCVRYRGPQITSTAEVYCVQNVSEDDVTIRHWRISSLP
jgi:hypothetical protein